LQRKFRAIHAAQRRDKPKSMSPFGWAVDRKSSGQSSFGQESSHLHRAGAPKLTG
jgi:hypothetical protein